MVRIYMVMIHSEKMALALLHTYIITIRMGNKLIQKVI